MKLSVFVLRDKIGMMVSLELTRQGRRSQRLPVVRHGVIPCSGMTLAPTAATTTFHHRKGAGVGCLSVLPAHLPPVVVTPFVVRVRYSGIDVVVVRVDELDRPPVFQVCQNIQ